LWLEKNCLKLRWICQTYLKWPNPKVSIKVYIFDYYMSISRRTKLFVFRLGNYQRIICSKSLLLDISCVEQLSIFTLHLKTSLKNIIMYVYWLFPFKKVTTTQCSFHVVPHFEDCSQGVAKFKFWEFLKIFPI